MTEYSRIPWEALKARHEAWWRGENRDAIVSVLPQGARAADRWVESSAESGARPEADPRAEFEDSYWTDPDRVLARSLALFASSRYEKDSFARLFACLGVASIAPFLGSPVRFTPDTIWYDHAFSDFESTRLSLDEPNAWLDWSLDATRRFRAAEQGRFKTGIPDIGEHMDVLTCLFDTTRTMMALYDCPEEVHRLLLEIQAAWRRVYQLHYEALVEEDGFVCYGPFGLLGKGKIAKLQCDVSAMMSPQMFDEFVMPHLVDQCAFLDKALYHLDGVDALKHLPMLLSIDKLTALQWTPGAGQKDGGDECWDHLYRSALDAGKCIYALVAPKNAQRFIKKFGGQGVFIVTSQA